MVSMMNIQTLTTPLNPNTNKGRNLLVANTQHLYSEHNLCHPQVNYCLVKIINLLKKYINSLKFI